MTGDTYTKLWSSIITSTVWQEPLPTKVVWITILALKDARGYVGASIPGLATLAGVTVEDCETAINRFLSPDKYSRTKEYEGRRLAEAEGGWMVLNHEKHRQGADADLRREQVKLAARRYRERVRDKSSSGLLTHDDADDESSHTDTHSQSDALSSATPSSGLVPEQYEPDLAELLTRVAAAGASTTAWTAEIKVARDGMHGPARTPDQIGMAIRDFNANGGTINLRFFRGFLKGTVSPEKPAAKPRSGKKPWEAADEREARDKHLNLQSAVHAHVQAQRALRGDEWWGNILADAKREGRWVVPYAFDQTGGTLE
jgi:hypothetical protein